MDTTGIQLQKAFSMNHQYYVYDFPINRLDLKSLIGEVREFNVYRTFLAEKTISEIRNQGYDYDLANSRDGKVIVHVKGKIVGTVESIIVESKPGQTMINLMSHNKAFALIVVG